MLEEAHGLPLITKLPRYRWTVAAREMCGEEEGEGEEGENGCGVTAYLMYIGIGVTRLSFKKSMSQNFQT